MMLEIIYTNRISRNYLSVVIRHLIMPFQLGNATNLHYDELMKRLLSFTPKCLQSDDKLLNSSWHSMLYGTVICFSTR